MKKQPSKASEQPRLSKEQLRKSRKGALGSFPGPALYESEPPKKVHGVGEDSSQDESG